MTQLPPFAEAQGKFQEAEPLLWRGLEGYKEELGSDHPDTLAFVNNLAHLLQATVNGSTADCGFCHGEAVVVSRCQAFTTRFNELEHS